MDIEIMVLNVMKYEKEGKVKSRLGYIMTNVECFSNSEKFKGYSELSQFADDTRFFDSIPVDFIGQKCTVEIKERTNPRNPLKSIKEFVSITHNGKTIPLVQSQV